MEKNNHPYSHHASQGFLSRGCCHAPQIYGENRKMASDRCCKLNAFNWLKDIPLPEGQVPFDCVEVRFKNSRKEFFRVPPEVKIEEGDIVAVEANPGHDIGIVSLTGEVVRLQMRKKGVDPETAQLKRVYRRAKVSDIEKWLNVVELEPEATLKSRKIARNMNLDMKIHDVEYQGDETKATFYYTADERVDFRELIKVLAEEFKVRIEMRQIGARQEAARLGGIGSCGRELCCATWLTDFTSVSTNKARIQQLPMNPQKLAGQCGKLKCCLNYEYEVYVDALKEFPDMNIRLRTEKGEAVYQKSDVFKKVMWYSYTSDESSMLALSIDTVRQIIDQNNRGILPTSLEDFAVKKEIKVEEVISQLPEEDIHRFDIQEEPKPKKPKNKSKKAQKKSKPQ